MHLRTIPLLLLSLFLCISACSNNNTTSSSTNAEPDPGTEPDLGAAQQLDLPPGTDLPGGGWFGQLPILPPPDPANIPALQVAAEPGQLHFQWENTDETDVIRLIRINPVSREFRPLFETRGHLANSWSYEVNTPLVNWTQTRFVLESCSSDQCVYSASVAPSGWQQDLAGTLPVPDSVAMDQAGSSLAITPDATAVVSGSPGTGAGALLVHFRVGKRWWSDKRLDADVAGAGARLGQSVAISEDGDVVIGGAPGDSAPEGATGSVFVFERFGEGWSQTARLLPGSDAVATPAGSFGEQVVISGDGETIIASAPGTGVNGENKAGAVWVYQRIDSQWRTSQVLTANLPVSNGKFGASLALSSDAGNLFVSDRAGGGQVHVYTVTDGQFSLLETLSSNSGVEAVFGEAISVDSAGTVLVASLRTQATGAAAVVYTKQNQQNWVPTDRLTPSGLQSADSRISLSTSEDAGVIAVGLWSAGSELNSTTIFARAQQTELAWRFASQLPDPSSGLSGFASSLALSGDGEKLLSGAPLLDHNGMPQAGGVYYY